MIRVASWWRGGWMMLTAEETYRVAQGGLMRCCLASLDDRMAMYRDQGRPLMVDGDTARCIYCGNQMVCDNSENGLRWRWAGEQAGEVNRANQR